MDNQRDQILQISNQNLTLLLTFSVVGILSVLINVRVFYIVFISSNRKSRPANILVAHLSSVVIGFTIVIYIYILEKTNVISLAAPGICNIFAFLRNNIHNMFPINAGAIIWIRTRSNAIILRKSFAYRSIAIMWLITIFGNLPSTFMVEYLKGQDNQVDKCKEISLLGSFVATLVYETLRFLLFSVMVCLYLIRATIKIRSSIKYLRVLKVNQSERLRKRIQQVQFIYLHTFVFVLNWFPNGLGLYLYKIFSRLGWTTDYVKFLTPFVFLNYSAFVLCPLSYVFLLEDIPCRKFFAPWTQKNLSSLPVYFENVEQSEPQVFGWRVDPIKRKSKTPPKEKTPSAPIDIEERRKESCVILEPIEMSGMTTVGLTVPSGGLTIRATTAKSEPKPVYAQGPSKPTALTPTTSAKLQNITVQVQLHKEPESKENDNIKQEKSQQESESSD